MKNVLITGSTRGIGKAIAEKFLNEGDVVILNSRQKNQDTTAFLKKINFKSSKSKIYYFDVGDPDQVETQCKDIIAQFDHIDILINNAGINKDTTFINMSYNDWDQVIKTNLYGPFNVTKAILPQMIKQKFGSIINISSIVGVMGNFGQVNYSASKSGLLGFTKSLAKEVARYHINVNAVCPGFTNTPMVQKIPKKIIEEKILPNVAFKRLAEPKEIADLIYFLSSDQAKYITGEVFNISGGWKG